MRRWLGIGLGALGALAVVIGARTAMMASSQPALSQPAPLTLDMPAASGRLGGALRFATVSSRDPAAVDATAFQGLHDHLAAAFPTAWAALRPEVVGGSSLLLTWTGRDPALPPLVLVAHLDVVPVEPGTESRWTHPPFSGAVADGAIWGRGALDDKASVVGILEAVEALATGGYQPARTVVLAFGADEEVGGAHGAAAIARLLDARYDQAALVLDEGLSITVGVVTGIDAPVALVGIAEKGYLSLELLVEAEGGHSSMPPPSTAAGRLARAVTRLEASPMPARLDGPAAAMFQVLGPEMRGPMRAVLANLWLFRPVIQRVMAGKPSTNAVLRTTMATTMLEGSPAENVLPGRARAVVNARIHPRDRVESVIRHVTEAIDDPGVRVSPVPGSAWEPSAISPVDDAGMQAIGASLRAVYPEALVAPGLVLGFTDARHYEAIGPNIYRFAPLRFEAADLARLHGTDERILVADYERLIRFYAELVRRVGG